MPVDVGIMPILIQAATNSIMALSRNACVIPREARNHLQKLRIFQSICTDPFDADVEGKKARRFKEAGIEYTMRQIDEYHLVVWMHIRLLRIE